MSTLLSATLRKHPRQGARTQVDGATAGEPNESLELRPANRRVALQTTAIIATVLTHQNINDLEQEHPGLNYPTSKFDVDEPSPTAATAATLQEMFAATLARFAENAEPAVGIQWQNEQFLITLRGIREIGHWEIAIDAKDNTYTTLPIDVNSQAFIVTFPLELLVDPKNGELIKRIGKIPKKDSKLILSQENYQFFWYAVASCCSRGAERVSGE